MIHFIAELITKRRGLFLTLGAILSRIIFLGALFVSAFLAAQLNPQESFTYRRSEIFRGPTKDVVQLAFRDDGRWLASASKDGNIFLWDFSQDYEVNMRGRARIILPLSEGNANDLIFTHDNLFLITGGDDQEIKFWDTTKLDSPAGAPDAIQKYIDFTLQAEDNQTFLEYTSIKRHESPISKFVLSDDQRWLASVDSNGIVYLWDLTTHNPNVIATNYTLIDFHNNSTVTDLEFSPSGKYMAISDQAGQISLWDLSLVRPLETLKTPLKIFKTQSRVYDIAFDLSYLSETKSSERDIFSVGADERVHRWPIWGTEVTDSSNFRKLHEAQVVKVGLTRDSERGKYWLVTADKDGVFVFWDMNKIDNFSTGRIGNEFYVIQGADNEITDMEFGLIATEDGTNDTNRHLMVTSSTDRSAQIWTLSSPNGQWGPIRLRPWSGRITNVVINPNNQYILTAGTDNTIRFWETSRVADTSQAFPSQAFVRYLIPALLVVVFAIHTTSTFIMRTHNITSRPHAIQYIISAIFGINFQGGWLFFFSLFFPIWPRMVVDKGRVILDSDRFVQLDAIGGPGKVIIRPGYVVSFQTIRTQTAVCTNQSYMMRPFERIRNIISLDNQYSEIPEVTTYTRDGIKITLKNIRMRYRVKFKANEENGNQNYRARYQNYPDPVDPEALDKALDLLFWNMAVERVTKKRVIRFVNIRPLDYFTAPETFNLKEEVREEFKNWVLSQIKGQLNSFGAEMLSLDVGVIDINPDAVRQTRQKLYTWRIRRQADLIRAQGATRLESYRELGRLKGEGEVLKAIIEEIGRWNQQTPILPSREALRVQFPDVSEGELDQKMEILQTLAKRRIFMTRMSEILRTYLRTTASDQAFLNFRDITNPNSLTEEGKK